MIGIIAFAKYRGEDRTFRLCMASIAVSGILSCGGHYTGLGYLRWGDGISMAFVLSLVFADSCGVCFDCFVIFNARKAAKLKNKILTTQTAMIAK